MSKRPSDTHDARELAENLLKSEAIQGIQRPTTKQDQTSFERMKGQDLQNRVNSDESGAQYQPFSAQSDIQNSIEPTESRVMSPSRVYDIYQQIARKLELEKRHFDEKKPSVDALSRARKDKRRIGNTIFVSGKKITKEFLQNYFSLFGDILNVSMEIEKERGFITFAETESADEAISRMHGMPVDGVPLKVELARRQPPIKLINDASGSAGY